MQQGLGYFWNAINPPGVPLALKFLVVPIEFFSKFLMRPFSLAVRLFANMTAGHLLLTIFAIMTQRAADRAQQRHLSRSCSPRCRSSGSSRSPASRSSSRVLQAYIFTILTAVYIAESMHPEH